MFCNSLYGLMFTRLTIQWSWHLVNRWTMLKVRIFSYLPFSICWLARHFVAVILHNLVIYSQSSPRVNFKFQYVQCEAPLNFFFERIKYNPTSSITNICLMNIIIKICIFVSPYSNVQRA